MTFDQFAKIIPAKVLAGLIDIEARKVITHRTAIQLLDVWLREDFLNRD